MYLSARQIKNIYKLARSVFLSGRQSFYMLDESEKLEICLQVIDESICDLYKPYIIRFISSAFSGEDYLGYKEDLTKKIIILYSSVAECEFNKAMEMIKIIDAEGVE